jgi:hypothetical protein
MIQACTSRTYCPETSKALRYVLYSFINAINNKQEHKFKKNIKLSQETKFKKELLDFLQDREGKDIDTEEINDDMQDMVSDVKKSKVHKKIVCEIPQVEEDEE